MIRIVNKNSTFITVEGYMILPSKHIDVEMPRTPSIRSLERNGIISVTELKEPTTDEIHEHNEIEQEMLETEEKDENEEAVEKSSTKKRKKNK